MPYPYTDIPQYYDGTPLSYADLNLLSANLVTLDGMVRRGRRAFVSHSRNMSAYTYDGNGMGDYKRLWYGGFQYRTGMTTATYVIYAQLAGGERLRITHDGAQVYYGVLASGESTINVTLSGLTDTQLVSVEIQIDWLSTPPNGRENAQYWIYDAYVSPVGSYLGAYPGVPSWNTSGDGLQALQLNQLGNAIDWLYYRMAAVPLPVQISPIYLPRSEYWKDGAPYENTNYAATISRDSLNTRFTVTHGYIAANIPQSQFRLYGNGVVVDSFTFAAGARGAEVLEWDMSGLAAGARATVRVTSLATVPFTGEGRISNRYSIIDAQCQAAATMQPPLTTYSPMQALSFTDVATALNAAASRATSIKNMLDTNSDVWTKARMYTGKLNAPTPTTGDATNQIYMPRGARQGDVLWVKGKNVKIGYGALTVEPDADPKKPEPDRIYKWTTAYNQDVISGDTVQQTAVYLDTLPGMFAGMQYFLFGDVDCAFEYITGF